MRERNIAQSSIALFSLLFSSWLAGNAMAGPEMIPELRILKNESGIEIKKIISHGPTYLIGGDRVKHSDPPDTPSGISVGFLDYQKGSKTNYKNSGKLQIVSLENYGNNLYGSVDCLKTWHTIIDSNNLNVPKVREILYKKQLSEIPVINAGRCFHGKLRVRTFPWGKAVLFLTTYVQGGTGGPVNSEDLFLVAQGVTNDGRYAVNVHFDIRHFKLPNSKREEGTKEGKVYFSVDTETKEAERWLDAQADNSFSPTFGQHEGFLMSLEITRGKKRGKRVGALKRFLNLQKKTGVGQN